MNWLFRHRFAVLLISILLLFIGFPLSRGLLAGRLAYNLLYTIVFLSAMLVVLRKTGKRRLAILFGAPMLIVNWSGFAQPDLAPIPAAALFHIFAVLFLGLVATTILMSIYRSNRITADSICGAFAGYLMVGVAFGHLYCLVERTNPMAFSSTDKVREEFKVDDRRYFLLTYFSFVTLTTVGYGEITPASELARALAAVEAILGQFYIAVLVADLIGKKLSQATGEPPIDSDESG